MSTTISIGSRRELMADDFLVDSLHGEVRHQLHRPTPREVVLTTDMPWEGRMCNYITVMRDPVACQYRMYYNNWCIYNSMDPQRDYQQFSISLATSDDGIHWQRAYQGHYPGYDGEETNIVYQAHDKDAIGTHGFAPFYDTNPAAKKNEWFKAIGTDNKRPPAGLYLLTSPDGLRWTPASDQPFYANAHDPRIRYDSQNVLFWDDETSQYRLYFRDYDDDKVRGIRTSTSKDLVEWAEPQWLDYGEDAPVTALYTNSIVPYYRAPHHLLGFPMRYVPREWSPTIEALPELEHRRMRTRLFTSDRCGTTTSDGLFMSSRDGLKFKRWDEAFVRPGLCETGNWTYADNTIARGMIETDATEPGSGKELSFFVQENYWRQSRFRRHTLRIDGFVSLCATYKGGTVTTKPLTFDGSRLSLNVATSAAGRVRVELQDAGRSALPGYAMDDCYDIVGDTLDYTVQWRAGRSLAHLSDKPVRLKIELTDADLYALQFVA